MPKQIFVRKAMLLTIVNLISRSIGTLYSIWLANKIGGEGVGLYQLVMSAYIPAVTLASSGISLAATRITAEEKALNRVCNIKLGINQCIMISIILGFVSSLILYSSSEFIGEKILFETRTIMPIKILSVALPFLSSSNIIRGYFIGVEKPLKSVAGDISEQLFVLISTVIVISNIKEINLENICCVLTVCSVIGEILSCITGMILYKRDLKSDCKKGKSMLKKIARISLPLAWSGYLRSCLGSVESILIPINLKRYGISKKESLSQYGVIRGMAIPFLMFPSVILSGLSTLLLPEISKTNIKNNDERLKYIIKKSIFCTLAFSVIVMLIVIAFSNQIAALIYKEKSVGKYFLILAGMIPIEYVDMIIDSILKGMDRQKEVMFFSIIDSAVSIMLIIILVPRFGIAGYMIMLYVGSAVNAFLGINCLLKNVKFNKK